MEASMQTRRPRLCDLQVSACQVAEADGCSQRLRRRTDYASNLRIVAVFW